MLSKRLLYAVRIIIYLYIIAVATFWFYDNYAGSGHINPYMLAIIAACIVTYFININIIDSILSVVLLLLSTYMLLAITSDLVDYIDGAPYKKPIAYFGVGYVMFGFAWLFSFTLLIICNIKK